MLARVIERFLMWACETFHRHSRPYLDGHQSCLECGRVWRWR